MIVANGELVLLWERVSSLLHLQELSEGLHAHRALHRDVLTAKLRAVPTAGSTGAPAAVGELSV